MKTLLSPNYEACRDFVLSLPETFDTDGTVLYRGRNILKVFESPQGPLVVKSFRKPHIINRFAYTFLRLSKARRSFDHALLLQGKGIPTPDPIACIEEYVSGLLSRSYFVSGYDASVVSLRPLLDGTDEDAALLRELSVFVARLHQQGVVHLDLSPGNILLKQTPEGPVFFLVDINRMKFLPALSRRTALRNFQALACSRNVSTLLAEHYAVSRGWEVPETVRDVNRWSDRFFSRKIGRLARKKVCREQGWWRSLVGPVQRYYLLVMIRQAAECLHLGPGLIGAIFASEKDLYERYIRFGDLRHVLEEKWYGGVRTELPA